MVPKSRMRLTYSRYTTSTDFSGMSMGFMMLEVAKKKVRKCMIFEENTPKHAGLSTY